MLQKTPAQLQGVIEGIAHVVVDAPDLARSKSFYESVLGLRSVGSDVVPTAGGSRGETLSLPSGQLVTLAGTKPLNDLSVSPAHQAYTVTPQTRDKIAAGLAAQGIALHRFHEDRPTEADDNYYFDDPAGNRIQLVAQPARGTGANAIDHVAIETHNIHWAREFYGAWLNCPVEHRVGWKTDDYLSAKALGEAGMAAAMPGARYWNERYSKFEKERKALRPNVQVYFTMGRDASLAVYLASRKYQAPRDDQILGAPRTALRTSRKGLDAVASFFGEHGRTVEGPVEHDRTSPIAASVYVKDPGGNFLEFCALR